MNKKLKAALERCYRAAADSTMTPEMIAKWEKFMPLPYAQWSKPNQNMAHQMAQIIAWQISEVILDIEVEGLTKPQRKILDYIEKHHGETSGEIAEALKLSEYAVSKP